MDIQLKLGDITTVEVDVLVNSAHPSLLGGGGVDGAIHRIAGPKLLEECRKLNGCDYGQAKATQAYNLPAKHVIHTVAPVYGRMQGKEAEILASCYKNSIRLADELGGKSIAFPSLGTGAFGYPVSEAAKVAKTAISEIIDKVGLEKLVMVLYSKDDFKLYQYIFD